MNQMTTYDITGMHCASCANIIERTISKIDGVEKIEVNYATEQAKIALDEQKVDINQLSKKIEPLGYAFIERVHMQSAPIAHHSDNDHSAHMGL